MSTATGGQRLAPLEEENPLPHPKECKRTEIKVPFPDIFRRGDLGVFYLVFKFNPLNMTNSRFNILRSLNR